MIKFLIHKPIAIIMTFLALTIIGAIACFNLPISMLPHFSVPEIVVKINGQNISARELENSRTSVIRHQLLQTSHLKDIESRTEDGSAIINLRFDFGTDIDLAYIEVNEKIDAVSNTGNVTFERPKVIKYNATDFPVFYLNITPKVKDTLVNQMLFVGNAVKNNICRRLEQIPEISVVDVTGIPEKQILLSPKNDKLQAAGLTISDLENILKSNNIEPLGIRVKDGYYQYNMKMSSLLLNVSDIENIYINVSERVVQLKDLCDVREDYLPSSGYAIYNGKEEICCAIYNNNEANSDNLKQEVENLLLEFESNFPQLEFNLSKNQTELLIFTIENLKQNLVISLILIFIIGYFFIGDARSSFIIMICIIVSLIISFIPFYIFDKSLNIISLSGIILAVGMMIDNALIICENINQYQVRGLTLSCSASFGTSELIAPLLSSSLTTVAVFVPLIFLGSIAGVLFEDQAFAIAWGLIVSYVVGIFFLPVLYHLMFIKPTLNSSVSKQSSFPRATNFYNKIYNFVLSHQSLVLISVFILIILGSFMGFKIPIEKMPKIEYNEISAKAEFNNVNEDENFDKSKEILSFTDSLCIESQAFVSGQDFMIDEMGNLKPNQTEFYWRTNSYEEAENLRKLTQAKFSQLYPNSVISFYSPVTLFDKLFESSQPDISAHFTNELHISGVDDINKIKGLYQNLNERCKINFPDLKKSRTLVVNRRIMQIYDISLDEIKEDIKKNFSISNVLIINSTGEFLPVSFVGNQKDIDYFIANASYKKKISDKIIEVPYSSIIQIVSEENPKTIFAGKDDEYLPINFYDVVDGNVIIEKTQSIVKNIDNEKVTFVGTYFENREMMQRLIYVLLVAVLLMYFILCAQFEDFVQPLIVLLEIPIDIALTILVLYLTNQSLNLMSAIGIIVSCGIVINDSILKIDTINKLRASGMEMRKAVHTAGLRRVKAILMTSLTTIGAVIPVLFASDAGSQMQTPLSVAIIAAMFFGTLVSIYIIPLLYMAITKNKKFDKKY
ncbi:MAG: efflux RND transporter permease subunit [Bacteroidales bacterium]|nr:efflux RND transporter permease subunit [Bacteroidales bacterium]